MSTLSMVAAVSRNGVIGKDGKLPWHLSSDLKRFKALTMGKPLVMGRKTHESIGRPLPGRRNLVITRNEELVFEGCEVVHSLEAALAATRDAAEVMVVGGEAVYREALPLADELFLTRVELDVEGDAFFPELNLADWTLVESVAVPPHGQDPAARFEHYARVALA